MTITCKQFGKHCINNLRPYITIGAYTSILTDTTNRGNEYTKVVTINIVVNNAVLAINIYPQALHLTILEAGWCKTKLSEVPITLMMLTCKQLQLYTAITLLKLNI